MRASDTMRSLPRTGARCAALAALLSLAWLAGDRAPNAPAWAGGEDATCRPGDLNDDAAVDLSDAVFLLGHLFQGGPAPAACAAPGAPPSSIAILVRHAERDPSPEDCPEECPTQCINAEGEERAERLARMLRDVELDHLVASARCRTKQTLQPTADGREGLEMREIDDPGDVAAFLRARPAGTVSLVAHHSFTLHDILEGLGLEGVRDIPVGGSSYDNLFVVLLPARGDPRLLHLHY